MSKQEMRDRIVLIV